MITFAIGVIVGIVLAIVLLALHQVAHMADE